MRTAFIVWVGLATGISLGCGGGSAAPESFGQHELGSLDEACEGVLGLTGQAVLDQRSDQITSTLAYVTASGDRVSPTALTIDLAWPAAPVAVCYPSHTSGALVTEPRVAIEGLSMRFATVDGKFDEELPAKAWLTSMSGTPTLSIVIGVTSRGALRGSWSPFGDYDNGGSTLTFVNRLAGASSAQAGGNVGLGYTSIAEAGAGIFRGANAVAVWPQPP